MIEIKNLSKDYNGKKALDSINIVLPTNGLVSVIGNNGSGKTTLLRILSTTLCASSGMVKFDNVIYDENNYFYIRNKLISYVSQEYHNYKYSLIEILNLFKDIYDKNRFDKLVKAFSFESFLEKRIDTMSGGQMQKANLILELSKIRDCYLIDEPTNSLDSKTEKVLFEVLHEISKLSLVVIVSHNEDLVNDLSDRIIKITDNHKAEVITCDDNKGDIILKDNVLTMPMNLNSIQKNKLVDYLFSLNGNKILINVLGDSSTKKLNNTIVKHDVDSFEDAKLLGFKLCIKNLIKNNQKKLILFSLIIGFFIGLTFFFINLSLLNLPKMAYNAYNENKQSIVSFTNDYQVNDSKDEAFNLNILEHVEKIQTGRVIKDDIKYDFNISFSGVSIIEQDFFSLKFGCYKKGDFLITDYIADKIEQYESRSYEDIITNGIRINDFIYKISGIIETDYTKYQQEYSQSNKDDWSIFSNNIKNIYSLLYIPCESGTFISILDGVPIKWVIDENISNEKIDGKYQVVINDKVKTIVGDYNKFFEAYNCINMSTVNLDTIPTIYTSSELLFEIKNNEMMYYDSYLVKTNYNAFKYMYTHKMTDESALYLKIQDANNIMIFFKNILIPTILIGYLITILVYYDKSMKLLKNNSDFNYLYKINGFNGTDALKLYLIEDLLMIACSLILGIFLNFGCNLILNLACGGGKYASIRIFNTSWLGIIIVVIMSFTMLLIRLLTFKKNKFIKFS